VWQRKSSDSGTTSFIFTPCVPDPATLDAVSPEACGVPTAYRAHLRRGETPCAACRRANAAYARQCRDKAEKRERKRRRRIGAYGVIKEIEILSTLPVEERQEYRRIQRRKRRSVTAQERLRELGRKAGRLHQERQERLAEEPPDTWYEDLVERMRAKSTA
jgi:hypothetical protein